MARDNSSSSVAQRRQEGDTPDYCKSAHCKPKGPIGWKCFQQLWCGSRGRDWNSTFSYRCRNPDDHARDSDAEDSLACSKSHPTLPLVCPALSALSVTAANLAAPSAREGPGSPACPSLRKAKVCPSAARKTRLTRLHVVKHKCFEILGRELEAGQK